MIRFPLTSPPLPLSQAERLERVGDLRFQRPECQEKLKGIRRVAVVGGGFAGLMAARRLSQFGVEVTLFEAYKEVGGRVRSNTTFSEGRITEEGAELIGSFHTRWLELARGYGLAVVSRMDPDLYEREGLEVKLTLGDKPLSMTEFKQLSEAMETRVLLPIARLARLIRDPAQPWLQDKLLKPFDGMSVQEALPKYCKIAKRIKGNKDEQLWKMVEFKLVNDEVAPLDQMNFLGLLCKVRGGQGDRFGAGLSPILDGYWRELEIFRCADGCQQLAKKMEEEINRKAGCHVWRNCKVTALGILKNKVELTRAVVHEDGKTDLSSVQSESFEFVILAIPPSVWGGTKITFDNRDASPEREIGKMTMADAVKFFSDVEKRFWITEKAAPYGGSSTLGQVWEGTDNQTWVLRRQQGIVLSVFAGPLLPGRRVPTEKELKDGLKILYPPYHSNRTLFANWPIEPFIETGYVSPTKNQILTIGQKLSKPYYERLFFAGEHTQMDFFGYMEGALRSGERAAHTLMLKACGLVEKTAPKFPSPPPQRPAIGYHADFSRVSGEQETEASLYEGALMNSDAADKFLGRAEHALRGSYGGRRESEISFLQCLLRELGSRVSAPGLSPAELFRAFLYDRPLKSEARDVLEVLAMPSQRPESPLRPGDWMLRAVPGTGDVGHVAVLASDDLLAQPMLASEGIAAESLQPGHYGLVIEAGAFPHTRSRPFARRWLNSRGCVPRHTVVLRPKYSNSMADFRPDERPGEIEEKVGDGDCLLDLTCVPHQQVPRTCADGKSFTSAANPTTMTRSAMNPGFFRASDGFHEFDTVLHAKLQNLLLDTPKYAVMLADESKKTRDPSAGDRVRVGLVDLTGDKICKPGYADWGSTIPITGGSTVKIAILYAAHQSLFDLNEMARTGGLKTTAELKKKANEVWSQLICPPDLDWLVAFEFDGADRPREGQQEPRLAPESDGDRSLLRQQRGAGQRVNHASRLRVHRIGVVAVRPAPLAGTRLVGREHLPADKGIAKDRSQVQLQEALHDS